MNPEIPQWRCLCDHAESQLSSGFATRAVCAARRSPPTPAGQFLLSAGTAALCALAVVIIFDRTTRAADNRSLDGWQQIAAASDDSSSLQ